MSKSAFYASKESIRLAHDKLFRDNAEMKKLLVRWEHFFQISTNVESSESHCNSCFTLFKETTDVLERKAGN